MVTVTLTGVVFGFEALFTALKVLLLELNIEHVAGKWMIGLSFVMESLLGISLTVILAENQWHNGVAFMVGAVSITLTELFSVFTEGAIIIRKLFGIKMPLPLNGCRVLRSVFKWLALILGGIAAMAIEIVAAVLHRRLFDNAKVTTPALVISVIFLMVCLATATLSFLSCNFNSSSKFINLRAFVSLTVMIVAPILAIVNVFAGYFGYGPKSGPYPEEFFSQVDASYGVIAATLGTVLVALTAWGVPNLKSEEDPDSSAVQLFEITAFGVCIPVLVISMLRFEVRTAKLVILTLLPQSLAIAVPTAISYITSKYKMWQKMEEDS